MKINCGKKHIQKASALTEKTAGHNPTLPILNAVLISTQNNKLIFTSTNLETALEVSIPANIKKEGIVAVPAKIFSSLISSLPDESIIDFNSLNNNLILTTSKSSTTIKGYPPDDFPVLPKTKKGKSFVISAQDFVDGLKSVYYSTSLSEIKPELNSVYVYSYRNIPLTFVATNSFRLAEKSISYIFSDSVNFLMPHRSVIEAIRIFENETDDLKIEIDENNISFNSGGIKFISRLVEGNFVDYKQLIPSKFENTAVVSKKELIGALKSAAMFCGKLNELKIKIYQNENFIEFQTNNSDLGEHIVKFDGKIQGDDLSIVFNHRYLIECLPSIKTENILLKFSGENKPLLVTGLDDNTFRYLVMPMRGV